MRLLILRHELVDQLKFLSTGYLFRNQGLFNSASDGRKLPCNRIVLSHPGYLFEPLLVHIDSLSTPSWTLVGYMIPWINISSYDENITLSKLVD